MRSRDLERYKRTTLPKRRFKSKAKSSKKVGLIRGNWMKDQDFIDRYVEMLPSRNVSQSEAEHRAGEFLVACAHISNMRHLYSNDKIKAESMERVIYGKLITSLKGTKITENKLLVESNPEYILVREELERIQADIEHLRHFHELFMNAHVFYRQIAKGDSQ